MNRAMRTNKYKKPKAWHIAWVLCLVLLSQACNDQPCVCPESTVSDASQPQSLTWESLDAETRGRIKTEVENSLRESLRAEYERECENRLKEANACNAKEANQPNVNAIAPSETEMRSPLPPTQNIERDANGLKVLRIVLSTSVVKRLPVDARDLFEIDDGSIFCFVEISVPQEEERRVTVRFTHATGLSQSYELPVNQSPAWRTWSKLNLTRSMTGSWLCEVFNEDGVLLDSKPFEVVSDL